MIKAAPRWSSQCFRPNRSQRRVSGRFSLGRSASYSSLQHFLNIALPTGSGHCLPQIRRWNLCFLSIILSGRNVKRFSPLFSFLQFAIYILPFKKCVAMLQLRQYLQKYVDTVVMIYYNPNDNWGFADELLFNPHTVIGVSQEFLHIFWRCTV